MHTTDVHAMACSISSSISRLGYRVGRDRIVVSTLRCGRSNLGSNPSHGNFSFFFLDLNNRSFSFLEKNFFSYRGPLR